RPPLAVTAGADLAHVALGRVVRALVANRIRRHAPTAVAAAALGALCRELTGLRVAGGQGPVDAPFVVHRIAVAAISGGLFPEAAVGAGLRSVPGTGGRVAGLSRRAVLTAAHVIVYALHARAAHAGLAGAAGG